jgi:hypothetical protein
MRPDEGADGRDRPFLIERNTEEKFTQIVYRTIPCHPKRFEMRNTIFENLGLILVSDRKDEIYDLE